MKTVTNVTNHHSSLWYSVYGGCEPSCSASLLSTGHFLIVHFADLSDPSVKKAYWQHSFCAGYALMP
jgi:hypothetical protein